MEDLKANFSGELTENAFAGKVGWRDPSPRTVARMNQRLGLGGELATIFDCIDADEGRLSQGGNV